MRVDQKNWRELFKACPTILLDGQHIDHVREADDAEGYVVVEIQGDNGIPKLDEAGTIATLRLMGKVKIVGERLINGR